MDKKLVNKEMKNLNFFYKQTSNADEFETP